MHKEGRKRKVGIVTPPDARSLTNLRTPSPKRYREENGDDGVESRNNSESEMGELMNMVLSDRFLQLAHLLQLKRDVFYNKTNCHGC